MEGETAESCRNARDADDVHHVIPSTENLMLKRILPLALLAVWAPAAFAFPPCPQEPVDLIPIDGLSTGSGPTAASATPWFQGWYALVGDQTIIDGIKPIMRVGSAPYSGKCRDRDVLPVLDAHLGNDAVDISPAYAPRSGFGVIALPDLRTVGVETNVRYILDFTIDNTPLAEAGEWFDVAELRFQWQQASADVGARATSTLYRIRKRQIDKESQVIEMIEARAAYWGGPYARPPIYQRVLLSMPIHADKPGTQVSLRWSQSARRADQDTIPQPPEMETMTALPLEEPLPAWTMQVDAAIEIFDETGKKIGGIALPQQWASELSMGLLNYRVGDASGYAGRHGVALENMILRAETF